MAEVIALVDDIFFQSKVRETAKLTGTSLEIVATGEQLLTAAGGSPQALIIVDLNARQGALAAIESIARQANAANPRRIIAFLSHVQAALEQQARAAGCQEVLPRSKFAENLAAILTSAKS